MHMLLALASVLTGLFELIEFEDHLSFGEPFHENSIQYYRIIGR